MKSTARMVLRLSRRDHISDYLKNDLEWLLPEDLCKFRTLCTFYKILVENEIAYFSDCFHWNSELHGHSTRGKSIRVPINPSSNIGRCMFSYRAVLLWNSLPNDIQDSPTFYVFKLKLKKYLLRSTDT